MFVNIDCNLHAALTETSSAYEVIGLVLSQLKNFSSDTCCYVLDESCIYAILIACLVHLQHTEKMPIISKDLQSKA